MNDDMDVLSRLHALATRPVGQAGPEALLEEVLDLAIEICDADFGNVQLVEPAGPDLRIVVQRGFPLWWIDFWNHCARGAGVCGSALESRTRVVVEDVATSPLFAGQPSLEVQLKAHVRAVQSTPLLTRAGTPVGILSTHFRRPRRLGRRETMWLDLLARQAADMIDGAQAAEAAHRSETRLRALAERSQAELFDERQRLRALLDSLPVGVSFTATPDCSHVTGNAALQAQFCVRPEDNVSASAADEQAPGRQMVYLRDGQVIGADELPLQRASREGRVIEPMELEVRLPDGKVLFIEASGAPIRNAEGELIGALAVTADITERRRAAQAREETRLAQAMSRELEQRVAQRTAELRRLAAELDATESRERQQISRDLHDDLGQLLSAARIRLANLCRDRDPEVRQSALAIAELIDMADRSTRSLATQLAPAALFELGLFAALERLAEEIERRFGLRVGLHVDTTEPAMSADARSIVYRAVRELLINVARHAGVDRASVGVREEHRQLLVSVSDEGDGFSLGGVRSALDRGMGLRTVRERLSYIDASVQIDSVPGYGTKAVLRIPLDAPPPLGAPQG